MEQRFLPLLPEGRSAVTRLRIWSPNSRGSLVKGLMPAARQLPRPKTLTRCGLLRASSGIVMVADSTDLPEGVKITVRSQEALPARVAPQVPPRAKSGLSETAAPRLIATGFGFPSVIDLGALG